MATRRAFMKLGLSAGLASLSVPAGLHVRNASAQADNAALKWGGNLHPTVDPHTVADIPSAFTRVSLYDTLFESQGHPAEPRPSVAKSHTVSPDQKVYDLVLHDNVRFHDGSMLTAEDVVYSFRRLFGIGRGPIGVFSPVLKPENVVATGAHAVRFTLEVPFAPFIATLPLVAILNSRLAMAHTRDNDWAQPWMTENDAGSGPYKVVAGSFAPSTRLDMEWFPDYWRGWPQPRPIKLVQCRPVREDATRLLAIEKGDIDTTNGNVAADQHARVRAMPGVRLSEEVTAQPFLMTMHTQRAPLSNQNFRKALSYAFPYELFLKRIKGGTVGRNPGPIAANIWGNPKDLAGYTYDLKLAEQHLRKAKDEGANVDREINFMALVGFDDTENAAQLLQSELRKIGIRLRISRGIYANVIQQTRNKETSPDIYAHWVSAAYVDPAYWAGQYTRAAHGGFLGGSWTDDPEIERLVATARAVTDRQERTKLYEQFSRRAVDYAPAIWVYNTKLFRAVRTRVKGYEPAPIGDGVDLRKMWLEG